MLAVALLFALQDGLRSGAPTNGTITDDDVAVETDGLAQLESSEPALGRLHPFEVSTDGTYVLDLRSYEFDAYLVVRDEAGAVIAEDNDGGLRMHSRAVLPDLKAGVDYTAVACALYGRRGGYTLDLAPAPSREPTLQELRLAVVADQREWVRSMEQMHGPSSQAVAQELKLLADALATARRALEARPIIERAIKLFEDGDDPILLSDAWHAAGTVREGMDDFRGAVRAFEKALALREELLSPDDDRIASTLDQLGLTLDRMGRSREGLVQLRRAVALREKNLASDDPALGRSWNNLGVLLYSLRRFAEARPLFERVLTLRRAHYGERHPRTMNVLHNLASVQKETGQLEEARVNLETVLEEYERQLGPTNMKLLTTLKALAAIAREKWLVEEAEEYLARYQFIADEEKGPQTWTAADARLQHAFLAQELQEHAGALEWIDEALALAPAAGFADTGREAYMLVKRAEMLEPLQRYDDGRKAAERALATYRSVYPNGSGGEADALRVLGRLRMKEGHLLEAADLLEQSVALQRSKGWTDHPTMGHSLTVLGSAQRQAGQYAAARGSYEEALRILEAAYGPDSHEIASTLNGLGLLLHRQGLYADALALEERALEIRLGSIGELHPDTAAALTNVASSCALLGEIDRAIELTQRVIAIEETLFGEVHRKTGTSRSNLALLYRRNGDVDGCVKENLRALEIRREVLPGRHPDMATTLNNVALIQAEVGLTEPAERNLREALEILAECYDGAHPFHVNSENNLGELLHALRRHDEAWQALNNAYWRQQQHFAEAAPALSERERFGLRAARRRLLYGLLDTSEHVDGGMLGAYEAVLAWKGAVRSRVSLAGRQRPASADETLKELRTVQSRLSVLALVERVDDEAARRDELLSLTERRDELERELHRLSPPPEVSRGSFARLAEHVPANAVFLDFLIAPRLELEPDSIVVPAPWAEERVLVWATRHGDKAPRLFDLGASKTFQRAIARFLDEALIDDPRPDQVRASNDFVWKRLIEPLADVLDGADVVLVSPDGFLSSLPFEILRSPEGEYLIERHAFAYQTSAAGLLTLPEGSRDPNPSLLSVGGVDYGARPSPAVPAEATVAIRRGLPGTWVQLDGTERESVRVVALHERLHGTEPRRRITGAGATETAVERALRDHTTIHLATHGFFLEQAPLEFLRTVPDSVGATIARRIRDDHPATLAGLVFAGANRPSAAAEGDPYWTADEVRWLALGHVDLVVLSACETRLGTERSAEGLLGLGQAFRQAGVRTVISSLWTVPDEATGELVEAFFSNLWEKRQTPLNALRNAQLDRLRRDRNAPADWGALVLSGEWR